MTQSMERRPKSRRERGQALVEFGLVAVVFFVMLFGIFDATRLLQSWITLQHSSREAARYAITGRTDCDGAAGRPACIVWTGKNASEGIFGGGPSSTTVNVTYKAWDFTGTDWSSTAIDSAAGKQCDQVEVKIQYTHTFVTPIMQVIRPSGITINGRQKMTNEPYGPCTASDGVVSP